MAGGDKQSFVTCVSLASRSIDIVIMRSGNKTSTPKTGEIPTEKNIVTAFTPLRPRGERKKTGGESNRFSRNIWAFDETALFK